MSATDWGPSAWKFLHVMTFMYPDNPSLEEQTSAENLFQSLRKLLPCERCRTHYEEEIILSPPNVLSKSTLSKWLVNLHNRVNVRLGKTVYSYEQAASEYSAQCSANCGASSRENNIQITNHPLIKKKSVDNGGLTSIIFICSLLAAVAILHDYKNYTNKS